MRAVVQDRYGSVDDLVVREIAVPAVADDEVLVRVHAASVHPDVWHVVTGRPHVLRAMGSGLRRPRQRVPGTDVAGVVTAVGRRVELFQPGDEVFGETLRGLQWRNGGAYAEYAVAPEQNLALKPDRLSFERGGLPPDRRPDRTEQPAHGLSAPSGFSGPRQRCRGRRRLDRRAARQGLGRHRHRRRRRHQARPAPLPRRRARHRLPGAGLHRGRRRVTTWSSTSSATTPSRSVVACSPGRGPTSGSGTTASAARPGSAGGACRAASGSWRGRPSAGTSRRNFKPAVEVGVDGQAVRSRRGGAADRRRRRVVPARPGGRGDASSRGGHGRGPDRAHRLIASGLWTRTRTRSSVRA